MGHSRERGVVSVAAAISLTPAARGAKRKIVLSRIHMTTGNIFKYGCTLALLAACIPPAAAQDAAAPACTAEAAAAPVCRGEITKPAELMKPVKVQEGLYALRCQGVVPGAMEPYPATAAGTVGKRTGGCSSVVNGNLMGRNLDFVMNNTPYALVWTERGADHYASLGMAFYSPGVMPAINGEDPGDFADPVKMKDPAVIATVPSLMLDGVNEKGVACSTLMADAMDGKMTDRGTNPGAPELGYFQVCRYVLDHAGTAREGAELLKKVNLVNKAPGVLLHWMISDGKETLVVEMHDDQVHVTDKHRVVTNYLLTKPEYTLHPYGIERADYLVKHLAEATTADKMQELMGRVRFSKSYRSDTEPFWWSEHYGMHEDKDFNLYTPHDNPDFQAYLKLLLEAAQTATPADNPYALWDTSYNAVYDTAQKTLRVTMHEKFGEYFKARL